MGFVNLGHIAMNVAKKLQPPMTDDEWQRRATAEAIAACKDVVSGDGINARAMIGSLSDLEWGWIVAAAIFGWIKTRAEQATVEGRSLDETVRNMGRDPDPWEVGALVTILPQLGQIEADWSKPIGEWSKEQITSFAWNIHRLTDSALAARDLCKSGMLAIDRNRTEREASAMAGGPLMSRREMDDEIPFAPEFR